MTDITDQGVDVITDETGQQLVKIVVVDDQQQPQGYAYVTPEDAQQILAGTAALPDEVLTQDGGGQNSAVVVTGATGANGETIEGVTGSTGGAVDQYIMQDATGTGSGPGGPTLYEQKPLLDGNRGILGGGAEDRSATLGAASFAASSSGVQPRSGAGPGGLVGGLWRPVILQRDHMESIRETAELVAQSIQQEFEPEPYHKKLGSQMAYDEMLSLMDYDRSALTETPERLELLRKHSMLFRPAGPNSRALTLYEQAVNEAAAQICRLYPALLFHKRELAIYAKQAIKLTGIEFPSSRSSYLMQHHSSQQNQSSQQGLSTMGPNSSGVGVASMVRGTNAHTGAPVGVSMKSSRPVAESASYSGLGLGGASGLPGVLPAVRSRGAESAVKLTEDERSAIRASVLNMQSEVPKLELKAREECSPIERRFYDDAVKLVRLPPQRLEDGMDAVRDIAAVYGGYRNPAAATLAGKSGASGSIDSLLTQFEVACNEAAAWLIRYRPALLLYRRELMELAKKAVRQSGYDFKHALPTAQASTNVANHSASGVGVGVRGSSSSNIELPNYRIQTSSGRDEYVDTAADEEHEAMSKRMSLHHSVTADILSTDDHMSIIEHLPQPGMAGIQPGDDDVAPFDGTSELAMWCDESDLQLDADLILRMCQPRGVDRLSKVKQLRLPACGITSINVKDLNACVNLRELDMSENALRVLPRCLYLPRLRRLNISGNRFARPPLVEQFPHLTHLRLDDKFRHLLNRQAFAFFCPLLLTINGVPFAEHISDFTRVTGQNARSVIEPHIVSRWEKDHAAEYGKVLALPSAERISLIELLVGYVMEKNISLQEPFVKFKDLLARMVADELIRAKQHEAAVDAARNEAGPDAETVEVKVPEDPELDDEDDEDLDAITTTNAPVPNSIPLQHHQPLYMFPPEQGTPGGGTGADALDATGLIDPMSGGASVAQTAAQQIVFNALNQGRCLVYSIVRPQAVSGDRPEADFLPGELRNKDYVKGHMASEIYKRTVKEPLVVGPGTTNLQASPPKRRGRPPGSRNRKSLNELQIANNIALEDEDPLTLLEGGGDIQPAPRKRGRPPKFASANADGIDGGDSLAPPPPPPKRRTGLKRHSLTDLGPVVDYDPLHFIRCHARENNPMDSETKVWRCSFEPSTEIRGETSHVVATCGGECVCLIDCRSGKVLKRFKHIDEEFYTIAWTTVEVDSGAKLTNLLAAAGRLREIRLLHPDQLVCYAELKGHTEEVACMTFHPTQPTILFSGDTKASILVWDIGVPSVPDYKTRYQLLLRLRCPRPDVNPVLNLSFLSYYNYLIAGCEDGIFAWRLQEFRHEKREREPDMELKIPTRKEPCFDGLAQVSESTIVMKCVEEGELILFDFGTALERRKGLQRIVPVELKGALSWQRTEEIYINVGCRPAVNAVFCGDNEGSIWLYDMEPLLETGRKFKGKPCKILDWPECSVSGNPSEDQQLKDSIRAGFRNPVVNTVDMSSDGRYLVAVTDNNLVCIWKFSEHSGCGSGSNPSANPNKPKVIGSTGFSSGNNAPTTTITPASSLQNASLSAHPLPTAGSTLSGTSSSPS